ncbi:MAG TPA: glycosyltransferase [Rhizomicrobium sp.]|jgi:glycosyltransferase involved in cell wall biosynthesis|nr:glycosyltransferase [Rhizomicrobium sp.]
MTAALNVLFVCPRFPSPETNGLVLRLVNIARQLALRGMHCHAVVDAPDSDEIALVLKSGGLTSVHEIPAITPTHWARVFRLSNENYLSLANPRGFRESADRLRAIAASVQAKVAVAESCDMAEYIRLIPSIVRIADICDSPTLTLDRHNTVVPARSAADAWSRRLERLRAKRLERAICRHFDRAITISEDDRRAVADSADERDRGKVVAISNGVSPGFLAEALPVRRDASAVAFWGNLDFAPNATAVSWFGEKVFAPFLAGQEIGCRVFGRNAPQHIRALAERHRGIELAGYAPDLPRALAEIPVMINPMIIGAGQKNKVLEAFGLGLAVVSTRLGMSGIDAVAGEHFLEANDPPAFAAAIRSLLEDEDQRRALADRARRLALEKYSWDSIGARWHEIILGLAKVGICAA